MQLILAVFLFGLCGEGQELSVSVPVFVSLYFAHLVLSPAQLSAFEALSPPLETLQAENAMILDSS